MIRISRLAISGASLLLTTYPCRATDQPTEWICVAEQATGFKYDAVTKTWSTTIFEANTKYIVRRPEINETKLPDKLIPPYIWCEFGKQCDWESRQCQHPPSEDTGLMVCGSDLDHFAINTKLLRMQRYYGSGYLNQGVGLFEDAKHPDDVAVEVGTCSPL